ncbi:unnamed protein product, partial [marine sediment metagenome]
MSRVRPNKLVSSTVPQENKADATYSDTEITIKEHQNGDTLSEFEIDVTTIFDGTAPKASIGIDSNHEKYLTEDQCYLKATGTYIIEDTEILSANETIKLFIT